MSIKTNYNATIFASYIGYITQAIVNNFAPLLFLTFHNSLGISMDRIALLITINFGTQLLLDFLSSKFVDRIGYRVSVVAAHFMASLGMILMAFLPFRFGFAGLTVSTMVYAVGGGLIEVVVSPIVEACPTEHKSAVMSILHSFYCWGQVFTVLCSTVFFAVFGMNAWPVLSVIWAVIPLFNAFFFMAVPIYTLNPGGEGATHKKLFSTGLFWIFLLIMVCSGASELAMSQWASAFAESALGVSKSVGDLTGMCMFAVMMGISRVLYAKLSKKVSIVKFMAISAVLCIISYLLASLSPYAVIALFGCALCGFSVGVMWPGTYSLAAEKIPSGGMSMFALLALAGDLGCSSGPGLVGFVSGIFEDNLKTGLLFAVVFPSLLLIGLFLLKKTAKKA